MRKYIIFLSLFTCACWARAQEQANDKMNVLLIVANGLSPSIGSFGDTLAVTPNIDVLAGKGTKFTRFYTSIVSSGPARISLFTGLLPDKLQLWDQATSLGDVAAAALTLPVYFRQNGYYTACVGKMFHSGNVDEKLEVAYWNEMVRKYTFPKPWGAPVAGYQNKDTKEKVLKSREALKKLGMPDNQPGDRPATGVYAPPFERGDAPDRAYPDTQIAMEAVKLIEKSAAGSKPFLIAVAFTRPHMPYIAPKKYWDMYDAARISLSTYQLHAAGSPDIAYNTTGFRQYNMDGFDPQIEDGLIRIDSSMQRKLIHGYYAATSYTDANIGRLLTALKDNKLSNNTIIVLISDTGEQLGDHSLWGKYSLFENATRIPLVIADPRAPQNIVSEHITGSVDLFPTLCSLVGLPVPSGLGGLDLSAAIYGRKTDAKGYALTEYSKGNSAGYSIRTPRYRYTLWLKNKPQTKALFDEKDIIGEELYDYQTDPLETASRHKDPAYEAARKELRQQWIRMYNHDRGLTAGVIPLDVEAGIEE